MPSEGSGKEGRGAWLMAAAVLALAVTVAAVAYRWGTAPAPAPDGRPDPRVAYKGPYRNVHPDVKYVGDAACVQCHVEIAGTFAEHPMGRSLFPTPQVAASQPPLAGAAFGALGRRFWVTRKDGKTYHHVAAYEGDEKIYEQVIEAHFVVGSGTHGYSYLEERDGHVFQTPISYYTINTMWGLSPGFTERIVHGRPVQAACLQCHAGGLKMDRSTPDRFEAGVFAGHAIGCERCHGPGEAHVRERERGDALEAPHDTATVNPRRLPWRTRDGVCMQCHLQGRQRVLRAGRGLMDFRPGMPFEEFFNVFVTPDAGEQGKTVGHFEEMRQSLCWQRTEGEARLGCISCHDPHLKPAPDGRVAFFRERCVRCHEGAGKKVCSEPAAERVKKAPGDSCIDCHMPPRNAKDVVHAALSDHRVPRRPGDPSRRAPVPEREGSGPLSSYFADVLPEDVPGQRRDLGVAMTEMLGGAPPGTLGLEGPRKKALALLQEAAGADRKDVGAWAALGETRRLLGETESAKDALSHALSLSPNDRRLLVRMGQLMERRPDEALPYYRRAVAAAPNHPDVRGALVYTLGRVGRHGEAAEQGRVWVRLVPGDAEARFLLCQALAASGQKEEARKEFVVIRKLRPPRIDEFEEWYRRALGK